MAYALDICDSPITAHAWNGDGSLLAICPNTSDIEIYEVKGKTLGEKLFTLSEHTQVVCGLDWHPVTNQLVSSSHDRNSIVFTYQADTATWKKDLVVLRLDRAATMVRWNHAGDRFCVTTGSNKIRVCKFMPEQNWWMSESINTEKPTQVYAEYFPDDQHILCVSTDRHCRYLTIKEDDALLEKDKKGKKKLNFCLQKFSAQGWCNSCAVSPTGAWIAYSTQDSTICFVKGTDLTAKPEPVRINIKGLPLMSVAFLSDTTLVGAGFDSFPRVYALKGEVWEDLGSCDLPNLRETATNTASTGMAARAAAFGQRQATKTENLHQNIITSIRVRKEDFTTGANDGRVGVWPFKPIADHFKISI